MVLGFMVFWPFGLAILGYKYWQRKAGGPDLQTVATGAYQRARSAVNGFQATRQGGADLERAVLGARFHHLDRQRRVRRLEERRARPPRRRAPPP